MGHRMSVLIVGITCIGGGMGGSGFGHSNNLEMGPKLQHNRSGTFEGSCQSPCKCDLC